MRKSILLLTILFCFLTFILTAQRFNGGVVAGFNFASLTGDNITTHSGANIGLLVHAKMGKKVRIGLEMLYSQNGEYVLPKAYPDINFNTADLKYIEIPLYAQYPILERDGRHRIKLQAGLSYTHLFDLYLENERGEDISEQVEFEDNQFTDIHWQAGLVWQFRPKWGINVRLTRPLERFLEPTLSTRLVWHLLDN